MAAGIGATELPTLPDVVAVRLLLRSSRLTYRRVKCEQEAYKAYEQHFKDSPPAVLRDCLELVSGLDPISIDEVPPLPLYWGLHLPCRMPPKQLPTQRVACEIPAAFELGTSRGRTDTLTSPFSSQVRWCCRWSRQRTS